MRILNYMPFFLLTNLKMALFHMHPDKSSGPDEHNSTFYHKFWSRVVMDIFNHCIGWLKELYFPPKLNMTNLTLILKCTHLALMKDSRLIDLGNVVYKILAKVLANQLKVILPRIISNAESPFAPGRSIVITF